MKSLSDQFAAYMDRRKLNENYQRVIQQTIQDSDVQTFLQNNHDSLNQAAIERSASKLYEFVREKNKVRAGKSGLIPGYIPKLVISNGLIDVSYEPSAALIAQQQNTALKQRVTRVNMPKAIETASFKDYDITTGRKQALMAAMEFVKDMITKPNIFHKGLYLYGAFGVGKTYLLSAIANELAQSNIQTAMIHFPTLAVEMRGAISTNGVVDRIDSLKSAPVLMLDDIGAESPSAWIRDDVLGVLLQYRMQEQLPTCFTSNFSWTELKTFLSNSNKGNEPIKAARIMERIHFLSQEISVAGENRR
ncbi:primosomal protein DnaI [Agrilactobacillus fermenti]|uniref:primosomal protein DnaI n=1 Tax=Agrilactobacillus fermenti TaxID=2586909 RepID=UPI003A5C039C